MDFYTKQNDLAHGLCGKFWSALGEVEKKRFKDSNNKPPRVVLPFLKSILKSIYEHEIHEIYHMEMLKEEG